jgi:hypothetical protein
LIEIIDLYGRRRDGHRHHHFSSSHRHHYYVRNFRYGCDLNCCCGLNCCHDWSYYRD